MPRAEDVAYWFKSQQFIYFKVLLDENYTVLDRNL